MEIVAEEETGATWLHSGVQLSLLSSVRPALLSKSLVVCSIRRDGAA